MPHMLKPVVAALALSVAGTSVAAAAQDAPASTPKPRLICKRTTQTGSLVAKRSECRTKEEWDRIARAARENAEYEMYRNASRAGGT